MDRQILHLFLPSLSLQVMVGSKKKFTDWPSVLCGSDQPAARVMSASPKAWSCGVRHGMLLSKARRSCRKLEVVTPRPDVLFKAGMDMSSALSDWSPMIERNSGGFYVDLSGTRRLFGPSTDTAGKVMREFEDRFGLVSSGGIASCKLVGRAASSVSRSFNLTQVMRYEEANFLGPFPLKRMLFKERKLVSRLSELGLARVEDLRDFSVSDLVSGFGATGYRLHQLAKGIDRSPVIPAESLPEIDLGETLVESTNDFDCLCQILMRFCAKTGKTLRERKLRASVFRLLLVYRDGARVVRKKTVKNPTAFDRDIHDHAVGMLGKAMTRRVQVIYIGLRSSRFIVASQPDLFGEDSAKEELYRSVDEIRKRYGDHAIHHGVISMS
jgi:DNA polymerase IV